jgi:hypothetical protein
LKRNKICFTQKSSAENSNISENSKNKSIKYPNTITNRRKGSKSYTSNKNIHSKIQNSSTFSKKNEKKEYYFSPSINKCYKIGKFKNSPLKDDAMLNNRLKKLRENNYEKIVNNYEKNARINLADDIKKNKKAIKELISLQEKGMRMGIEKKSNKDTFDNYLNFDMVNPEDDKLISNNKFLEPLFTMEIKIKQNIKKLQVFEDDNPEKIAEEFCKKNMLNKESYNKIVTIIKYKLLEIKNGIINNEIYFSNNKTSKDSLNEKSDKVNYNKNSLKKNINIKNSENQIKYIELNIYQSNGNENTEKENLETKGEIKEEHKIENCENKNNDIHK